MQGNPGQGGKLCGLWRTGPGELERGDQIRREICNLLEKRREEMLDLWHSMFLSKPTQKVKLISVYCLIHI